MKIAIYDDGQLGLVQDGTVHDVSAALAVLPVAATDMRRALHNGHSIRYLTPDTVVDYIQYHHLYQ